MQLWLAATWDLSEMCGFCPILAKMTQGLINLAHNLYLCRLVQAYL